MTTPSASFTIVPGAAGSPLVLHVPHSGTAIPADARSSIVLDDAALQEELAHMTDAHTATLAMEAARLSGAAPWLFINRLSRLVIDPERLPDEEEEMAAIGMAAVYTATSHRTALRAADPARDAALRVKYADPYATAFTELVEQRLAATGQAVIIDEHSYPSRPLPYELHQGDARPAVCVGTDEVHTSEALLDVVLGALEGIGSIALNQPFRGTYVPLRHYGRERRVQSVMVEIRRDTYMEEPGGNMHGGAEAVVAGLAEAVRALTPA